MLVIREAMQYIKGELDRQLNAPAEGVVVLGNISRLDSGDAKADLKTKIVLTLINIEEEKTLKNSPIHVKEGETISKIRPKIFLNLYLLFSHAGDYTSALDNIDNVIAAFQKQNVFVPPGHPINPLPASIEKLIVELYDMNFEQQNHLWGMLGGKHLPSVLYKVRLVVVQGDVPTGADVITSIRENANVN